MPCPRPPEELRFRLAVRPATGAGRAPAHALLGFAPQRTYSVQEREPAQRRGIPRRRPVEEEKGEEKDAGENRQPRNRHYAPRRPACIARCRGSASGNFKYNHWQRE